MDWRCIQGLLHLQLDESCDGLRLVHEGKQKKYNYGKGMSSK